MIGKTASFYVLVALLFIARAAFGQTAGYPKQFDFPEFECQANNGDSCHVEQTFTLGPGLTYCSHKLTKTHGGSGSSNGFVRNNKNSVTAYVHAQSAGAPNGYGSDSRLLVTIFAIPETDDRRKYGDRCSEPTKWKTTSMMCLCVQGTKDSKIASGIATCFDKSLDSAKCIPSTSAMALTPAPVCRANANECETWSGEQCNVWGSVSVTASATVKDANYCAKYK